nr:MAG TPA: hypothetical protein [Bacteriophage sp.]
MDYFLIDFISHKLYNVRKKYRRVQSYACI